MPPDTVDVPEVATEAIVIVDLVESASTSNLFGWYAVGRSLMRDLRGMIHEVGDARGLQCLKSIGDGYLLAFRANSSAELAVLHAIESALLLLDLVSKRNRAVPEERVINLRLAVHFGEVDVIANDREGPHVTYAFRLESIDRDALADAFNPIPPEDLPLRNYILCSEEAAGILERRSSLYAITRIGLLKLQGFPGWREVFLVLPIHSNVYTPESAI